MAGGAEPAALRGRRRGDGERRARHARPAAARAALPGARPLPRAARRRACRLHAQRPSATEYRQLLVYLTDMINIKKNLESS